MELVTLYRVQHPELKCGPWNTHVCENLPGWNGNKELVEKARTVANEMTDGRYMSRHPSASSDIRGWNERYVCAADSLEKLKSWFRNPDLINAMADAGFTVIMVKVEPEFVKYSRSGMQVGYDQYCVQEETDLGLLTLVE